MFENLRRAVTDKPLSMKAYAEFLGVTEKTLQNKMNGVTEFSLAEVEKTSKYLFPELKIDYLFDRGNPRALEETGA